MTDADSFAVVLRELRELLLDFGDLRQHIVLFGGQVLAAESVHRGGTGVIELETRTQVRVDRGFSMDIDLLLDVEAVRDLDVAFEVLRRRDYGRVRGPRWYRKIDGVDVFVDLFAPAEADLAGPTGMIDLPQGGTVMARTEELLLELPSGRLELRLPGAYGFLTSKLISKQQLRPDATKDSFDLYAYVETHGAENVAAKLEESGEASRRLARGLLGLFEGEASAGVEDVLAEAGALGAEDEALLRRAVIDTFVELAERLGV